MLPIWANETSDEEWWSKPSLECKEMRKAMASIIILVSREIWKERNARVPHHLVSRIKDEVKV